jgi:hypothetical protein
MVSSVVFIEHPTLRTAASWTAIAGRWPAAAKTGLRARP